MSDNYHYYQLAVIVAAIFILGGITYSNNIRVNPLEDKTTTVVRYQN